MSVTHVFWRADSVEFVDPEGYNEGPDLVAIEEGWQGPFMVPDFGTRTFVPDLESARASQWEIVKSYRDAVRYGGCETPLGRMDTDLLSQNRIANKVTEALLVAEAFSADWTMADNTVVTHDADQMKAAWLAVGAFDSGCQEVGGQLRIAIDEAETVAEIMAVDPAEANWPTFT